MTSAARIAFGRGLAGLMLIAPSIAVAQVVEVHLREGATAAPIAGVVVRLLRDSTEVERALTNAGGRALLRAPAPGVYRIRVNRIGFKAILSDTFSLSEHQAVAKELSMTSAPFVLPAVAIQTKSECGAKMSDGPLVAALWEQIATALAANVLTQSQWALPLQVRRFRRDVALSDSVLRELVVASFVVHGPPFGSTDPKMLAKRGFVYSVNDDVIFSAPDAALLLSDEFVAGHCFSAVPGADGSVGLKFDPVPRRKFPDVRGTLWLNRQTSELQYLQYSYTGLQDELASRDLGGRIDFRRLPTGAWIVSYWHIRMPIVNVVPEEHHFVGLRPVVRPEMRSIASFVEEGGRVDIATETDAKAATSLVTGRIFDSTTSSGLSGAVVRIMGQPDSVFTDSIGQFRISVPIGGSQTLVATHPKLGLVADSSTRDVHLSLGDSTMIELAVPPTARLVKEFCGATDTNGAGLIGLAFGSDGAPAEGLDIRVTREVAPGKAVEEERAESGPKGTFVVCDLPTSDRPWRSTRRGRTSPSSEQPIRLEPGDFAG